MTQTNPDITADQMADGLKAFEMVKTYSDMGYHRTGTKIDDATIDWLMGLLQNMNAEVTCPLFPYSHYDATVKIIINDQCIEAMALYYAYTGSTTISRPAFAKVKGHDEEDNISRAIITAVADAKQLGHDGLILITDSPNDALCGINRKSNDVLDFPVILIGKKDCEQVQQKTAQITISATTNDQMARNVIARFRSGYSADQALPVLLTTPVSGWFNCASERGCGIAIALILAEKLSAHYPLDLLLASGHELGFEGGYQLAEQYEDTARVVLHLGSSIANIGGEMISICSAPPQQFSRISAQMKRLDIQTIAPHDALSPHAWVGEAKCWAAKNWPMHSIAGISPHFHTPLDQADKATTPALLASAIENIYQATIKLIEK